LPSDENEKAEEGVNGGWWIKWGTLHYYDKIGKEHTIEASSKNTDTKWPNNLCDDD
jgi:hypothetical protein